MTPTIVIGKIATFEMSRKMCQGEEPISSRLSGTIIKGTPKTPNLSW
jgi:hypothetical protein